jgi:molybdopterin-guanine dinucleotide biosynthesis protein A
MKEDVNDPLMGVILCGGESKRMGSDKGSLLRDGIPWALHVAGKLAPFGLPVVFSVNKLQMQTYPAFIPSGRLVPDSLPIAGQLKGLLSVHERFPSNDLLLLACDMLDMDEATIGKMITAYREDGLPAHEAPDHFYIYQEAEFIQPFCGIYTARGLRPVYARAVKGELQEFSLRSLFNEGKTKRLQIEHLEAFENYNNL